MKIQALLIAAFTLGCGMCYAQNEQVKQESQKTESGPPDEISPYIVLKVDNKSAEFDPMKNETLPLESIDANSIVLVSILNGDDATALYGEKGRNGVIVITLKDFDHVPEELRPKFAEVKD